MPCERTQGARRTRAACGRRAHPPSTRTSRAAPSPVGGEGGEATATAARRGGGRIIRIALRGIGVLRSTRRVASSRHTSIRAPRAASSRDTHRAFPRPRGLGRRAPCSHDAARGPSPWQTLSPRSSAAPFRGRARDERAISSRSIESYLSRRPPLAVSFPFPLLDFDLGEEAQPRRRSAAHAAVVAHARERGEDPHRHRVRLARRLRSRDGYDDGVDTRTDGSFVRRGGWHRSASQGERSSFDKGGETSAAAVAAAARGVACVCVGATAARGDDSSRTGCPHRTGVAHTGCARRTPPPQKSGRDGRARERGKSKNTPPQKRNQTTTKTRAGRVASRRVVSSATEACVSARP